MKIAFLKLHVWQIEAEVPDFILFYFSNLLLLFQMFLIFPESLLIYVYVYIYIYTYLFLSIYTYE